MHARESITHRCPRGQACVNAVCDVVQAVLRITPNIFCEGFTSDAISGAVTQLMTANGLDPEGDAPGCLDAVEVGWWSGEALSPVDTLKQLAKMCVDKTETDADSGEVTVTAAKMIKALGVYDFSARCASCNSFTRMYTSSLRSTS